MKHIRSATQLQCLVLATLLVLANMASAQVPSSAKNCQAVSNGNNSSGSPVGAPKGPQSSEEIGDATVVAIVDYEPFTPYHRDLYASKMPQHLDADPSNDLPLHCSPETWLPGFTTEDVDSFEPLNLSLEDHSDCETPTKAAAPGSKCPTRVDLSTKDGDLEKGPDTGEWGKVVSSGILGRGTASAQDLGTHMYWIPGSKVVGALSFGTQGLNFREPTAPSITKPLGDEGHGVGSTSVSVGNFHGTCPQCLLVFIQVDVSGIEPLNGLTAHDTDRMEQALEWAYDQPWIDVISMPGTPSATPVTRERLYQASDVNAQKKASERGQTIFISSGNGHEAIQGALPTTTLQSSMQGPDWIMTVSGTDFTNRRDNTKSGLGKFVDVSGVASEYPAAMGAKTVGGEGDFVATSNAVAMTSGMYAEALYSARRRMSGPSRTSAGGVISTGSFSCGMARADCELGDGALTADELRNRFLMSPRHSDSGIVPAVIAGPVRKPVRISWEEEYLAEGHGTYLGRCQPRGGGSTTFQSSGLSCLTLPLTERPGEVDTLDDLDDYGDVLAPLLDPLFGVALAQESLTYEEGGRPPGETDWFTVDSYCRQLLWGKWSGGIYKGGDVPPPAADAPLRQAYREGCPLIPTPHHKVGDRGP